MLYNLPIKYYECIYHCSLVIAKPVFWGLTGTHLLVKSVSMETATRWIISACRSADAMWSDYTSRLGFSSLGNHEVTGGVQPGQVASVLLRSSDYHPHTILKGTEIFYLYTGSMQTEGQIALFSLVHFSNMLTWTLLSESVLLITLLIICWWIVCSLGWWHQQDTNCCSILKVPISRAQHKVPFML